MSAENLGDKVVRFVIGFFLLPAGVLAVWGFVRFPLIGFSIAFLGLCIFMGIGAMAD